MADKDNVVSIFSAKKESSVTNKTKDDEVSIDLEAIAAKNQRNQERLKKERLQANKSTLRSYRIKH